MKNNIRKLVVFLSIYVVYSLIVSVYAIDINRSIGEVRLSSQEYTDNLTKEWYVNIGENSTVRLIGNVTTESGRDFVYIYNVDANGNAEEEPIATYTGQTYADLTTTLPTGRMMVKFVSDYSVCGYAGFTLHFLSSNADEISMRFDYTQNMMVKGDFVVNDVLAVGSSNRDARLVVKGKIHAEEVIVNINTPADYVFKPEYRLRNLYEVESYVNKEHHLPDIPEAKILVKKGFNAGEMQNLLLQKVEELTLYMIQQDKKLDQLETQTDKLKQTK